MLTMADFGFQWHLTDRCNLRCRHCYQDDFSPASERPIADLKLMADRILGAIPDLAVSINLTGGEPFLLPCFFDLLDHLHGFPNLEEIHIITNGTVATDAILDALGPLTKVKLLKVSIESHDISVNDAIRGPGDLKKVISNIERFQTRAGKQVVLMATLARHNLASVQGMVDLSRKTGSAGVIFERFVPLGLGRDMAGLVLDASGWREAVSNILMAVGSDANPESLLAYRAFWVWTDGREEDIEGAACNLGEGSMAMMPDGAVYPCRRLPLAVGNVLCDPFEKILEALRSYHPLRMKPRLTGALCAGCGLDDCMGCRALALALTGDPLTDDPQCLLNLP